MFNSFSSRIQQIGVVPACLPSDRIDIIFTFNWMEFAMGYYQFELADEICTRQDM